MGHNAVIDRSTAGNGALDSPRLDALLLRFGVAGEFIEFSGHVAHTSATNRLQMLRHANFLFLCGYDEKLGNMLYNYCDAFLMPSSYEPCGISQLLALRAGKPVLVHAVGGLADTIQNGINGFSFEGKDELEQANNLVATLAEMLQIFQGRLPHWRKLCRNAAATRFSWDQTVAGYLQHLYGVKSR